MSCSSSLFLPRSASVLSSSNWLSKWSSMTPLLRPVTKMKCSMPAALASSTTCWITGRSTTVSISLGIALVAGRNRVPSPATGKTALRTRFVIEMDLPWQLASVAASANPVVSLSNHGIGACSPSSTPRQAQGSGRG